MDHVELFQVQWWAQGVTKDEAERIARLRHNIHASDFKPGAVIAFCGAAGAAEQVE